MSGGMRYALAWRIGGWLCLTVATLAFVAAPMTLQNEWPYRNSYDGITEAPRYLIPIYWIAYFTVVRAIGTTIALTVATMAFMWRASGRNAIWWFTAYAGIATVVAIAPPLAQWYLSGLRPYLAELSPNFPFTFPIMYATFLWSCERLPSNWSRRGHSD